MATDPPPRSSWNLAVGDPVGPGRTVMRRSGGGDRYEVYVAWDEVRLSPVVVKRIRPEFSEDAPTLRGLTRDVELMAAFDHPYIVRVLDHDATGPHPHITLNRVPGKSLSSHVRRRGPLDAPRAMLLGQRLASALHYVHHRGYVHLDVKPSNVMFGQVPTLIDFSLARSLTSAARLSGGIGTPHSMAPEQVDPARFGPMRPPADVWGLGATLYFALAGERPFPARDADPDADIDARFPQLATPPGPLPASVPEELASLVLACLTVDQKSRPTALDVFNSVRALSGEPPMPGQPLPVVRPARKAPSARPKSPPTPEEAQRRAFKKALRAKQRPRGAQRPL